MKVNTSWSGAHQSKLPSRSSTYPSSYVIAEYISLAMETPRQVVPRQGQPVSLVLRPPATPPLGASILGEGGKIAFHLPVPPHSGYRFPPPGLHALQGVLVRVVTSGDHFF